MLIYASVVLNMYVRMLYLIYKKRGDYNGLPEPSVVREAKQAAKEDAKEARTSTVTRESSQS